METALVILEARGNKFNSNDQKLIDFISKSAKRISVLAVNCNLACVKTLKKISKVYLLAVKRPINVVRNGCCFALLVSGLILMHDITIADNDSCYHNVVCRAATAVNRYVVSGVHDILEGRIFVRSVYAGRINQHVSYNCPKPWIVSVKLPLISDYVVVDKVGEASKQVEEGIVNKNEKVVNKSKDNLPSEVETKGGTDGITGVDKGGEADGITGVDKGGEADGITGVDKGGEAGLKKADEGGNAKGSDIVLMKNGLLIEKEPAKDKLDVVSEGKEVQSTESVGVGDLEKEGSKIEPLVEDKGVVKVEGKDVKEMVKVEGKDVKEGVKVEGRVEPVESIPNIKYQIINFPIKQQSRLLSYSSIKVNSDLPELTKAAIVIAGGRSFCTEENFMM